MTKKLRIRFIVFSMLALLVMQSLIIFFSAQRSYNNLLSKTDALINLIKNAYPDNANVDARYFVVTVDRNNGTKKIDLSHISSIKYDKAQEYVQTALDGDTDIGFANTFRYRIFREYKGITIIFLSRNYNLDSLKNSVFSSILFSFIGMCVMFVLLFAASYWVTHPIANAYNKQQQFITSASHELGTPLTVIKADTDILLSDDPDNEWLRDIDKQTMRLTTMTHNLITLAKLDEQGKHIKQIEFPISDLAEDVVTSYRAVAENENRIFHAEISADMSYNGDENLIRQLFTILLDNAFKYCPEDGTIDFCLNRSSQGISVCVTNTTEQIGKEQLDRIFDRFYRSESAASSNRKGHGLRLAIADSIVRSHKGKITAKTLGENEIQISVVLR